MKIPKKYAIPALALGLLVMGGATASAATGQIGIDVSTLAQFTDTQKTAIEKAFQIRKDANEQAKSVLSAAGVDEEKLHEAMRSQHGAKGAEMRSKLEAALDANDFAAFQALGANTPMQDKLTSDTFAKLVEIRKLEKAGDKEGAMKLRQELGFGAGMGMGGMMRGPHGPGEQR